ncbi:MAG: hypothetical protein J6S82_05375 [Bacteroidales bacterium]|nr:hypothetical protein [Bacteroidales bacterium]
MNIRDIFGFREHRRVMGRLRRVAFGHAATVCGAMVTLAAFYTLWILIMHCTMEDDPHHVYVKQMASGNVVIERLNAYRDSCGVFPESLESIGFRKSHGDNFFSVPNPFSIYYHIFEYILLDDTSFYLGYEECYGGREQYLSSEGRWRMVIYGCDDRSERLPEYYEGRDVASVYLHEYEIVDYQDTIRKLLETLINNRKVAGQQFLLTIFHTYDTVYSPFSEEFTYREDTVYRIRFNSVLQTFDLTKPYACSDLFSDIDGYLLIDGHVCFFSDRSWLQYASESMKRTGRGQVFTGPVRKINSVESFCLTERVNSRPRDLYPHISGGRYWFLDLDFSYSGKASLQGGRMEE